MDSQDIPNQYKEGELDFTQKNLARIDLSGKILRNVDFSNADLSGADLSRADLRSATFHGANLSGANLQNANLKRSSLLGADLSRADLRCATFHGANLSGANLQNADLKRSSLLGADFTGADLRGADLTQATVEDSDRKLLIFEKAIYNQSTHFPVGFNPRSLGARLPTEDTLDKAQQDDCCFFFLNRAQQFVVCTNTPDKLNHYPLKVHHKFLRGFQPK
jgi:uncharacterized protein YjbI with pentapeptide repeats